MLIISLRLLGSYIYVINIFKIRICDTDDLCGEIKRINNIYSLINLI